MSEAKPSCISKWEVWEAYKRVKANKGAYIDRGSRRWMQLAEREKDVGAMTGF